MYYTYKCTYCKRLFYAYDRDKHRAANTLYHSIKQHLREYNEDHKEYQLDDGEHADTEQILHEMQAHSHLPAGAYEAKGQPHQSQAEASHTSTSSPRSSHHAPLVMIILVIILGVCLLLFVPGLRDSLVELLIP